jgi:glutamate racemase
MSPGPTIGVFDSGFGGLTVLRALLPLVPAAHYIYLGDTARLPYGSKSRETIARYAVESAHFLEARGADLLVIACNTATALALDDIRRAVGIPVIGVIEPGAQAALTALSSRTDLTSTLSSRSKDALLASEVERPAVPSAEPQIRVPHVPPLGHGSASNLDAPPQILVLATAATVQSHAYRADCDALGLSATEVACPLLVPLVEEGWTDHAVTRDVIRIYLQDALTQCAPDAVLLGCTHYPLIAAPIEAMLRELGSAACVIDSAASTARGVAQALGATAPAGPSQPATFECFATDSIEKFQRLGSIFLGQPIPRVELLDLGG